MRISKQNLEKRKSIGRIPNTYDVLKYNDGDLRFYLNAVSGVVTVYEYDCNYDTWDKVDEYK